MTTTESHLLLVDDDPQNLFLMSEVLELEGYTVQLATSGMEALAAIKETLPQLVLLDIMMPDINGFEVCQHIRNDPRTASIPVIFLTALDDDQSQLKSIDVMGDDYLTKPIQMTLLLKKIASLLKLTQLRNEAYQRQLAKQFQEMQAIQQQYRKQMISAWKISEALAEKFHLFVPKQFLTRVAPRGVESIRVGNAIESDMTIMFCDIRDFTAIVESQQARQTFNWLNVLFEQINQAVTNHNGFVDKYLGDAVMAVFDQEDHHATDALKATISICKALAQFNCDRQQFELANPIRIGIGLHSGIGLIGTVGANQRMDTSVVGDVVNTASRLEELTKTYRCPVLSSETLLQRLPADHTFQFRNLDRVTPRGKSTPLDIYEFLGYTHEPLPPIVTSNCSG